MVLLFEMICEDAAETQQRKDNTLCLIPTLFSAELLPPPACRATRCTPDKSAPAEKKYQDTKALYVMLSCYIDFFFFCIFDRQHKIVASCRVKQGFRDCAGSTSTTQIFLGLHVL